jgi:hypothetical protein
VGVGEAKIGRFLVKNTRESHVLGIPSKLPKKLTEDLFCKFLKLQGGKLPILKLWGLN